MAFETLPETNLTGADIRDMLNEYGGNVGDDFLEYFSEDANLNWSSKKKPVCYNGDFLDTDRRWKGNGDCGFIIPALSHYNLLPDYYNSDGSVGMNGWEYDIPDGNTSSRPMRLGDFRGYCPVFIPFVQGFVAPDIGDKQEGSTIFCQIAVAEGSDTHLGLNDIDTVSGCYFGVYAVKGSYSTIGFGSDNSTVELLTGGMTGTGTWTLYPFLSNNRSHGSGSKYYPVPNVQIRTVEIVTDNRPIQIMILGYYYPDSNKVTYEVRAKNKGSSTAIDGTVYLKYEGNDLATSIQTGEKSKSFLGVSFGASSSYVTVLTGTFTSVTNSNFFNSSGEFSGMLWYAFGNTYTSSKGTSPMRDPSGQL